MSGGINVEFTENSGNTNRLQQAVERLAASSDRLAAATDRSRGATERSGAAARRSASEHDYLSRSLGGVTYAGTTLTTALGGIASALGISKLIETADAYTNMSNRLRVIVKDQGDVTKAMNLTYAIAQKTRTDWEKINSVYARTATTLARYNKPAGDAAKVTELFAKAVAFSGSSSTSATAGIEQFQQGMGSATFAGDELKSMLENLPGVAEAVARGMRTNVDALKAMGAAGQITGKQLAEALLKSEGWINNKFVKVVPSISQAMTNLNNAFVNYIGSANQASGASGVLANAIIGIANNMNIVIPLMASFIALLGVIAVATAARALFTIAAGFVAMTTGLAGFMAVAGGPLTIALAAITAAGLALDMAIRALGGTWTGFIQSIPGGVAFLELAAAAIEKVKSLFGQTGPAAQGAATAIKDYSIGVNSTAGASKALNPTLADTGNALGGVATKATQAKAALTGYANGVDIADKNSQNWVDTMNALNDAMGINIQYKYDQELGRVSQTSQSAASSVKAYYDSVKNATSAAQSGASANSSLSSSLQGVASSYSQAANAADNFASAAAMASANQGQSGANFGSTYGGGGGYNGQAYEISGSSMAATGIAGELGATWSPETGITTGGSGGGGGFQISESWQYFVPISYDGVEVAQLGKGGRQVNMNSWYTPNPTLEAMNKSDVDMVTLTNQQFQAYAQEYMSRANDPMISPHTLWGEFISGRPFPNEDGTTNGVMPIGTVPGFATGGSFMVGGKPGNDNNLVQFWASSDERVDVLTRAQQRAQDRGSRRAGPAAGGAPIVYMNVYANDADSLRRSKGQNARDYARELGRRTR